MTVASLLEEPGRVDEPQAAQEYAAVLTQVVSGGRPVILHRNGEDLAAVIPLEHLERVREILAHQDVERLAAEVDWTRSKPLRPPQSWFDDEGDNPFEAEQAEPPLGASSTPTSSAGSENRSASEPTTRHASTRLLLSLRRHADAGLASYTAGLVAAAAFMALSLGPGWLGFLLGFLPVSLLTSWAVAGHA